MPMSMREQFAELAHMQWALWASSVLASEPGLSPDRVERWRRLIRTPYAELTEAEKDQDRVWADRYLAICGEAPSDAP